MKTIRSAVVGMLLSVFVLFTSTMFAQGIGPQGKPEGFTELKIGDSAPDFSLPGVDGKTYKLADFASPDVLMVMFTGTHCPTSHGVEDRLQAFIAEMKDKSFGFVAINPNHSSGLRPDEFGHTDYDETFEDSKRYANDLGWEFPFLYDGDQQTTARAYGCLATPHVFVFDKERKLRYNGRFDDSRFADVATVKHHDARNAVDALFAGEPVPVKRTRPHGCSTKWKERSTHVAQEEKEWQSAEVTVNEISAKHVAALRKNGTGKLRLFNVWATWCVPCVKEMPELTAIARKFSRREFELITISLDEPNKKDAVAAFLGKHRAVMSAKLRKTVEAEGRRTNNYIFGGASTDELAEALDPDWPGPVPYSLLVDQNGKVLHRYTGVINPLELRSKILDTLSSYHTPKVVLDPVADQQRDTAVSDGPYAKQITGKYEKGMSKEGLQYQILGSPSWRGPKRYPLIVWLHGGGECGSDNHSQIAGAGPRIFGSESNQKQNPSFVLAPQCPSVEIGWKDSVEKNLMALLDDLIKHLPIDRNRIYLIGQSMGGGGSWRLAGNHPDTFAAVVPICGWGSVRYAEKLKSVPIWAFHGAQDQRIPVTKSRDLVSAIKSAGGEKIKYSELAGEGHMIAGGVCKREDLRVWIYSQSKAAKK